MTTIESGERGTAVRKWILKCSLSPGDVVMLTAALRDLHAHYPGLVLTDVRTPFPELWENNPHLTPLKSSDPDARVIDCTYPLIHKSNTAPGHFLQGFVDFLNAQGDLRCRVTRFKGDIHLSEEEKRRPSPVAPLLGSGNPYWIVAAGGKYDFTIKWWHRRRYQEVIDHFRGRIDFVQVGQEGHYHPPLKGVVDLRGKTTLRELVLLVHHAAGVLCPVTFLMHLAAAVETPPDHPAERACVVVAGGREPPHWEAYPTHQFIHTVGMLDCCRSGGCWKTRTVALHDGDPMDAEENLCVDVVAGLPRCMDRIRASDVIRRIEMYGF